MKRLLTLIFALLTLTMATQNVYAKATKNLIVYLTDGMCLDDSNEDAYMAVSALIAFGHIEKEYNNILHSDVYSSVYSGDPRRHQVDRRRTTDNGQQRCLVHPRWAQAFRQAHSERHLCE
jgi:hypothetical protein